MYFNVRFFSTKKASYYLSYSRGYSRGNHVSNSRGKLRTQNDQYHYRAATSATNSYCTIIVQPYSLLCLSVKPFKRLVGGD